MSFLMQKYNPAIVILAYKRPASLDRLLKSIDQSFYEEPTELIISLEFNSDPEVIKISESFENPFLNKKIIYRKNKLGLRDHVLSCGDLTKTLNSIVMLEDDILVDKYFHYYAKHALNFYDNDILVSGISLYSYERNELSNLPFQPMNNGYSTYPMRLACSWGQCWTKDQWSNFRNWYEGKTDKYLDSIIDMPLAIKKWPESSWKKYFQGYINDKKMHFIYPYTSYSTNCSDTGGTHITEETSLHQTSLPYINRQIPDFKFCPSSFRNIFYDAHMEQAGSFIQEFLNINQNDIEIDIQGTKTISQIKRKKYLISSAFQENALSTYPLSLRPPEANLQFKTTNNRTRGLYLVESDKIDISRKSHNDKIKYYTYFLKADIYNKKILNTFPYVILKKIAIKIKKIFKIS